MLRSGSRQSAAPPASTSRLRPPQTGPGFLRTRIAAADPGINVTGITRGHEAGPGFPNRKDYARDRFERGNEPKLIVALILQPRPIDLSRYEVCLCMGRRSVGPALSERTPFDGKSEGDPVEAFAAYLDAPLHGITPEDKHNRGGKHQNDDCAPPNRS